MFLSCRCHLYLPSVCHPFIVSPINLQCLTMLQRWRDEWCFEDAFRFWLFCSYVAPGSRCYQNGANWKRSMKDILLNKCQICSPSLSSIKAVFTFCSDKRKEELRALSINPLSITANHSAGHQGGLESIPARIGHETGVQTGQFARTSESWDKQPFTLTLTSMGNLESPINLRVFGLWRPDHP